MIRMTRISPYIHGNSDAIVSTYPYERGGAKSLRLTFPRSNSTYVYVTVQGSAPTHPSSRKPHNVGQAYAPLEQCLSHRYNRVGARFLRLTITRSTTKPHAAVRAVVSPHPSIRKPHSRLRTPSEHPVSSHHQLNFPNLSLSPNCSHRSDPRWPTPSPSSPPSQP